jgi:integral membrane sensor domain MASE1
MQATKQCPGITRIVAENLATGVLVYLSALATRAAFASDHTAVSPIWPAGGVALAAALLLGWRVAPGILASLVFGSVGGGNLWVFSIAAPVGVVASLYLGRRLLSLRGFNHQLGSTRDILLLASLGAVVPAGLSGFWISGCLAFTGSIGSALIAPVGVFYWMAYAAGAIVVAPVILLVAAGRLSIPGAGKGHFFAGVFQVLLVATASVFAFHGFTGGAPAALAYLPFPFIVWLALSRGLGGAALAVLVCVGVAVWATSVGRGPFVSGNPLSAFWQLEAFIAIMVASGLLIGAGSDAQRREKALQAEAATRKAELERLKAQVNPHFLFNCLTAIHSLIRTDSVAAEEGLTSLSSLLRKSLDVAKHPLIPLAEELGNHPRCAATPKNALRGGA